MKTVTFKTAAENEYASPARLVASFSIDIDEETYDALAAEAPEKSRYHQEIDSVNLEDIKFNNQRWSIDYVLKDEAELAITENTLIY